MATHTCSRTGKPCEMTACYDGTWCEKNGLTQNYMQTIPDSHFWTSIEMLMNWVGYAFKDISDIEADKQHLMIGLSNTLSHGFDIQKTPPTSAEIIEHKEGFL